MTGTYATTWARVYMNEIIYAVVAVIVVFLVIFLSVKLYKKFHKTTVKTDAPVSGSKMWILVDTALGFGSALSILFFTLLILFLSGYVTTSYYSYGYTYGIFMILAAIIILMIYAFLALFAPVYRGKKRGWVSFGLTFFTEILFLIIMAVIFMSVITMPQLYTIYPAAF